MVWAPWHSVGVFRIEQDFLLKGHILSAPELSLSEKDNKYSKIVNFCKHSGCFVPGDFSLCLFVCMSFCVSVCKKEPCLCYDKW